VLRSKAMKERFGADERFRKVATVGPFDVLQLKNFGVSLVEPLMTPLRPEPRDHWLDRAFRRFLLDYPYKTREVYLGAGEPAPDGSAPKGSPVRQGSGLARRTVHLLRMDREHLVFETDAVGYPHIVRMSYHPKWRSTTGEHIYLVEPCFMLLVPRHSHIELVYGTSRADVIGRLLSVLGMGLAALLLASRRLGGLKAAAPVESESPRLRAFAAFVLCTVAVTAWAAWSSPERAYGQGQRALAAQQWETAGRSFDAAFAGRHAPARKAEALFWAARSYQYGKRLDAARRRYLDLVRTYPESYWVPESMYRLAGIAREKGDLSDAGRLSRRLQQEFPDSSWATRAEELLDRPSR
jgi:Tetratricopeptide repeat